MKVQILSRPDHSLFLYNYIRNLADVQLITFNAAKRKSLLHRLYPAAKLVDDKAVILYDFILFDQIIFRMHQWGWLNGYKWEGKYADFSYGLRARGFQPEIIHYWPLYCYRYVNRQRQRTKVATVADVYSAHPSYVLGQLEQEYDQYGLDVKDSYFYVDADRTTAFLRNENNIITNSNYVKESFLKFAPGKNIYVADYGFLGDPEALTCYNDAFDFQNKQPDKTLNLIYVGTVSIEKGVHYLLRAVEKMNTSQVQLHIIGKVKPGQEKIFKQFQQVKGVHFLGHLSNAEVKRTLKKYSVLVLPSLSDANSIAVIEALQNALPVIITENTGNRDAVTKYGVGRVVAAGNTEAIIQAIEVFMDRNYRKSLSLNIRNYIVEDARYPYPQRVFDIYKQLLSGNPLAKDANDAGSAEK
jgi:glycosyltransferase involved in cell wall biosynthesis